MSGIIKRVLIGTLTFVCILAWSTVSTMAVNAKDNGLHLGQREGKKDKGLHLGQLKDMLKKEYDLDNQFTPKFGMQLFFNILTQVSDVLDVEEQVIIEELKEGRSFAEIAEDYDVSKDILLVQIKDKMEEAIRYVIFYGIISDEQADKLINIYTKDLKQILEYKFIIFQEEDPDIGLKAPVGLTATTESDSEIFLDWNSVNGATSYHVYRAASYSGDYSRIAIVTTSSYTDDDLEEDTTYYYKIKAHSNDETSVYSSIVHATTDEEE